MSRAALRLAIAVIGLTVAPSAIADRPDGPLWSGAVAASCRIRLVNELGGVRVDTIEERSEVRVLGDASLVVDAVATGSEWALTVAPRVGGSERAAGQDVVIQTPPRCRLEVRTDAGSVTLAPDDVFAATVSTVTGDITLISDLKNVTIRLATSGEITVDYTVKIQYRHRQEPAKVGSLVVGDGTTQVRLTSLRGTVSVLRPAPAEPG